jgi:hypothetical protein
MVRKFWRVLPSLCLLACSSPSETPLLVDGRLDEPVVLPVVMSQVATLAGSGVERICIAQAEDAFTDISSFAPEALAPLVAADPRLSGNPGDCRLQSWNDAPPPESPFVIAVYYRNGARWMLDMASKSVGSDGFDRSWFNDYLRRFKSGHALIFVRLDRTIHFFEVEPSARGPRVVSSDEQGAVAPAEPAEDSDG